ncbi:A-kinase anchor protein 17A isoform X3 [Oreochromis aureus]|uniref:A kinase (PRKA) anchor protein 17A n=2 Tax=Oreochromis aureus TaxID=47969 RepID=A0A668VZE8_OREAU|nr:A-kinase anchor protein 17A isoform X3 [Oreochromis aureus]XP_039456246.1 A-kinase anchor protein 17A isoform X3 [Oreochromis aureus]XP_039456247.1 A-kinase anchor protein 17A isoform X3 [Oreochromis aureus]XP_039456249.1 A-kinase anchor protein 17A isoform X3 [Oreochromis aureus]
MTTIVHDTTEAVCLSAEYNLYLKPIAKMTISVALPQLKLPGKSISNWEVMERVKAMVAPEQFSVLRISKSTMDFIRFEGEVENKTVVKSLLSRLDGKSIKLSGFTDVLKFKEITLKINNYPKVRAVENKVDFPTRHDWDSFFRDAKDMNETLPGERPDTIHLEGLPCRWFSQKDSQYPDRPSEEVLIAVFQTFGKVRNVDIPMLDPYREEMMGKNFSTFSFGGHLNFEAYVQYQEYCGFTKAMDTLRSMKLMLKGDDGKAVACNIKVTFDTSKHLSDASVKKRNLERMKLQELERQREEQKQREKEEEERRKEEERKQKELEEEERERKKEERLRKREQKLREREERRNLKKVRRQQEEEQKKLQMKIALEERRLLLAQRNLESIRLIAELLARAKALKQEQQKKERAEQEEQERKEKARQNEELARLQQLEACRRKQEEELRRVEVEKERALELQRREKELRERLLSNLLKKNSSKAAGIQDQSGPDMTEDICNPDDVILGVLSGVNGLKAAESKEKQMSKSGAHSQVSGKNKLMEERREGEDRKKDREGRREEVFSSKHSRERARDHSHRERSSHSRGRRRRSHSRRRRSCSHRRRSYSHHRSRRRCSHSHCSRSISSSRERSWSSTERSSSRGRSHRHSHRRGSGRSSDRGRDRRSHSHYSRRYRRHSNSRDRSHSRRC